ncbi:MAG: metallophosphoesterase [SAR324 cluster bacterium]|nr:metallophosphoesterase [SAR324 cluster bacterium]
MNQRQFKAVAILIATPTIVIIFSAFLIHSYGKDKGCLPPQELPAFSVATQSPEVVSFVAFGDAGEASQMQRDTFAAATKTCEALGCDFALLLGDNFYEKGIKRAKKKHLKKIYQKQLKILGLPLYVVLGNHDVKKNFQAQIDLHQIEPLWNMPSTRYQFTAGPANFIALNSNCHGLDLFWGKEQLTKSAKKWNVILQHHTIFSTGSHGDAPAPIGYLWEQLDFSKLDLFLSGHDHNLEHLTKRGQKAQYVISGSASRPRSNKSATGSNASKGSSDFYIVEPGFVWIQITRQTMEIQYFDSTANLLYKTKTTKEE